MFVGMAVFTDEATFDKIFQYSAELTITFKFPFRYDFITGQS